MKSNTVSVVQNPEAIVPVEVLAESITAISQGVKKLLAGPLTEDTIILLITNATPGTGPRYNRKTISATAVRAVLRGMESLESQYLKPKRVTGKAGA